MDFAPAPTAMHPGRGYKQVSIVFVFVFVFVHTNPKKYIIVFVPVSVPCGFYPGICKFKKVN